MTLRRYITAIQPWLELAPAGLAIGVPLGVALGLFLNGMNP